MDRAVDSAAAEQGGVRRVDDRVDVLHGDVAEHRFELHCASSPAILAPGLDLTL